MDGPTRSGENKIKKNRISFVRNKWRLKKERESYPDTLRWRCGKVTMQVESEIELLLPKYLTRYIINLFLLSPSPWLFSGYFKSTLLPIFYLFKYLFMFKSQAYLYCIRKYVFLSFEFPQSLNIHAVSSISD